MILNDKQLAKLKASTENASSSAIDNFLATVDALKLEIADLKRQLGERDARKEVRIDPPVLVGDLKSGEHRADSNLTSAALDAYVQEKVDRARSLCKTIFEVLAEGTPGAARNSIWEEDRDLFDTFIAGIEKAVDRAVLAESEWWYGAAGDTNISERAERERIAANREKVKKC